MAGVSFSMLSLGWFVCQNQLFSFCESAEKAESSETPWHMCFSCCSCLSMLRHHGTSMMAHPGWHTCNCLILFDSFILSLLLLVLLSQLFIDSLFYWYIICYVHWFGYWFVATCYFIESSILDPDVSCCWLVYWFISVSLQLVLLLIGPWCFLLFYWFLSFPVFVLGVFIVRHLKQTPRVSCEVSCLHFSICASHPCAGATPIFSVSFQL